MATDLMKEICKKADEIKERVVKFRRGIHMNPELSGKEEKTAALVSGILEDNDIEVRRGVGGFGVVGLLRGKAKGGGKRQTVALRADMDALPVQDYKKVDYASCVPGVMHACGHDVHTAVLMGTAIVLAGLRGRLRGNVKFIFQPSEEMPLGGAGLMIEEGALKDPVPNAIVALHAFPELPAGMVGHRPGMMTASADRIRIIIKGKSGHASRPHQSVDAVLVSSMVINAIHHIVSRRTDPLHPAVISIGMISGGTAPNVIADMIEMQGTVRTLDADAREKMPAMIEEVVKGVCLSVGAEYEFEYQLGSPSVVNDEALDKMVRMTAVELLGEECVVRMEDPMMGAEDFSLFAEKVPGTLFRLGTTNAKKGFTAPLHNSNFDVDESCLQVGTKMMSWFAASFLNGRKGV